MQDVWSIGSVKKVIASLVSKENTMFRLIKAHNRHRALIIGPLFDHTLYLGYHHIEHNIFTYSAAMYREAEGVSFCSWSLKFDYQRRPVLPVRKDTTPTLEVVMEEDATDPTMFIPAPPSQPTSLASSLPIEPKPVIELKAEVKPWNNPKTGKPYVVGNFVRVKDPNPSFRNAIFYRQLKQDDECGWYVKDFGEDEKQYVEYDTHTDTWYYVGSKPNRTNLSVFPSKQNVQPTSTAMVAAKFTASPKIEVDDPVVEEVYSCETDQATPIETTKESVQPKNEVGASFTSFSETAADLLPPETSETVKIGDVATYFAKPVNLTSAQEEWNEYKTIAMRHGNPLPGFIQEACGSSWPMKEDSRVIFPAKKGGHWELSLHLDDDGWYVENEQGMKVPVFFDHKRDLWAIDRVI